MNSKYGSFSGHCLNHLPRRSSAHSMHRRHVGVIGLRFHSITLFEVPSGFSPHVLAPPMSTQNLSPLYLRPSGPSVSGPCLRCWSTSLTAPIPPGKPKFAGLLACRTFLANLSPAFTSARKSSYDLPTIVAPSASCTLISRLRASPNRDQPTIHRHDCACVASSSPP